jgi:hypothetical protein
MSSTFFGVQLAIRSPAGDAWRERLVALVRKNQTDLSILEKRVLYTELAELLSEAEPQWALGTWDFIDAPAGDAEFDSWVAGIEECVDEPLEASASSGDHAVVTFVFLVEDGSRAETTLAERCDIPEEFWSRRRTYARLVATLRMLVFAGVLADGVYVVPGDVNAGLTLSELRGEGWDYLTPLED